MFGKNKISKPQFHDGSILNVQEIFATFQGEGPYVGYPAVFIRLGGCNLACNFCDTEFDSYKNLSLKEIIEQVKNLAQNKRKLIVITGGEPFIQPIEELCQNLIELNFLVQIETNGTIFRQIPNEVKIICSPKAPYFMLRDDLLSRLEAIKFIISANASQYNNIAQIGQEKYNIPIYLQPMDEYDEAKNHANIERTLELANQHGTRISLQTHKILKIA